MCKRDAILCSAKKYIDENLNPKKQKILDRRKENFIMVPTISEILQQLNITPEDYYNASSISSDNDFQIRLKRQPNECFINSYFVEGLQAWKANIDIQSVFNHYKAVTHMCVCFSKAENEISEAMKEAAKEAGMSGKTVREKKSRCKSLFQKKGVLSSRGSGPINAKIVAKENIS